eukprot:CAMPEP_0119321238 /NCGR_PEP_ID=MMETSP1333-20130426/54848_1 /TAXON_ID=418940 /ORGANISM="Scyphosphaera apsteinii, Strain RCC1455" /LENGTH=597 /DNA_ID=CAMNT_0007328177 /DNA_START=38 /DNA_END=1831 /DNA_ORIENTATION=-
MILWVTHSNDNIDASSKRDFELFNACFVTYVVVILIAATIGSMCKTGGEPPSLFRGARSPLFAFLLEQGRITEAEYDRATDELASEAKSEDDLVTEYDLLSVAIGAAVEIFGLSARPDLNGCRGYVEAYLPSSKRFKVSVSSEDIISIRPGNLKPVELSAPPAADVLLRMGRHGEARSLSAFFVQWAIGDKEVARAALAAVTILGSHGGPGALDELVSANQSAFIPALVKAITTHSDDTLLTLGGLAALATLSTGGGGVEGAAWKESSLGCARCDALVKQGALDVSVRAMNDIGFADEGLAWDIHGAGLHIIANICVGNDGEQGVGKPQEACARREAAVKAGAIEVIVDVMQASVARDPPKPTDTRQKLVLAHRALQRVCMGLSKAASARRERAVMADALPVYVNALDRFFSSELFELTIHTNMILMNQTEKREADPFLDRVWQNEVEKRPSLAACISNEMVERARAHAASCKRSSNTFNIEAQNTVTVLEHAERELPILPGQFKDEEEREHFERVAKEMHDSAPAQADELSTWAELVQDQAFQAEMADIKCQADLHTYVNDLQEKNPRRLALLMHPDNMNRLNELLNGKGACKAES